MILTAFLGVLVGIFCGLTPGIHTNLIAVVVASLSLDPVFACVFLVCVAITNSIVDAVPSVFLGASEDVMALLPGHKLLVQGFGVEAVKFTVIGSLFGIVLAVLLVPLFIISFPFLFAMIKPFLFYILVFLVGYILFKGFSWWNLLIFFLSGFLGLVVLYGVKEPLFPLLSGLFGGAGLILSTSTKIPEQKKANISLPFPKVAKGLASGVFAGSIVTLFPGLGPSQAAALLPVKNNGLSYLVLIGALGSVDVVVSLVTWFVMGKARNGAVVILKQIVETVNPSLFIFMLGCVLFSVGIASIFSIVAALGYAKLFTKINYTYVCVSVIIFLNIMVIIISGWLGLLTSWVASFLGMIPAITGTNRSNAMGCLILPILLRLIPW
ncbi:tripartite tricarboxylate transporter permease [Candidatus Woesearchaeota archaeon]|nr:tripartite tricarboxylate transporter permease [Candidatus Woesearchaeota archaeon]